MSLEVVKSDKQPKRKKLYEQMWFSQQVNIFQK